MLILIFHHCWSEEKRYHQFCSAGKWMQIFEKIGVAIYYWCWHWYWLLTFTKEYRYYQCKILYRGKSVQLIFEAIAYIERSNEMAIKELGQHMCPMLLGHFTVCTMHATHCTMYYNVWLHYYSTAVTVSRPLCHYISSVFCNLKQRRLEWMHRRRFIFNLRSLNDCTT